ncbi:MAG: hypothetical protein JWQ03_2359 [Variovorax sp.]|nr:hypothetical protein [Variovorax sp.]
MMNVPLSNAPIGYYADDFTGASANLLEFHRRGFRGLLFVNTPSRAQIDAHLPGLDVIGIAGVSRSLAPAEMAGEVRPALELLRDLGCPVVQYKICSTFDSSPDRGNFGTVLELARELYGSQAVAVLAAHPAFGRYTAFANHFAEYEDNVHRLDRHPSMSRHPATPMHEADLRLHLAQQTAWPISSCDFRALRTGDVSRWLQGQTARAVVFDAIEPQDLERVAAGVWQAAATVASARDERRVFTLSSHGFAAGLADHLAAGRPTPAARPQGAVDQLLVLSGSCAPRTAAQIAHAKCQGWAAIPLEVGDLGTQALPVIAADIAARACEQLARGHSVVVYSAAGPQDEAIAQGREVFERVGGESSAVIGSLYGDVLRRVTAHVRLPRLVLAGGDTSSQTMRTLGIEALSIDAVNTASQEPFLRMHAGPHSASRAFDGTQVLLKAGQNGPEDYFTAAQRGDGWA